MQTETVVQQPVRQQYGLFEAIGIMLSSLANMTVRFSQAGEKVADTTISSIGLVQKEVDNLSDYQEIRLEKNQHQLKVMRKEFQEELNKLEAL